MQTDFIGLWVTADHSVRKLLLPNGRFIAMRGEQRFEGDYEIEGSRIVYRKDNGMSGEGEIADGVLRGGGAPLYLKGYEEMAA